MTSKRGRLTIPSESGYLEETKRLIELWGADGIRDSDGTKLDDEIKQLAEKVYTTYFVARNHNDFINQHRDEIQQMFLLSERVMATSDTCQIDIMTGFLSEQIEPNHDDPPNTYWEVVDRTTGELLDSASWTYDETKQQVNVTGVTPYHEYTVSFLAYVIWDPTQMYNHITNDWGDVPHDIPFDVRKKHSKQYMADFLKDWLTQNDQTDIVRFTTFFYHFTLFFNDARKEKFVDWFGYGMTVSVQALSDFEKVYGYRLRAEDFVDEGYYNSTFRVPSKRYLDYMAFIQKFVSQEARTLVDLVHDSGKEAMMFLGDNWIGTEPYGEYFSTIGLDAVVGSVGNGTTLRMISEIPSVRYTEGRFLPYFFPDVFREGNDPTVEAQENWLTARRAIMRKPVDRIGYGGYLSLANQFPDFVEYIRKVADEFREIYATIAHIEPYTSVTVGIVNAWGKLRSWQTHMVAHALWYQQTYSYLGVLEALSGQKVKVVFLSFDDVREGRLAEVDVLINAGDAGTSFSGGTHWLDAELIAKINQWVIEGGGLIGIGEPSAVSCNGRYFQLASLLGVDKELGFSLSTDKYFVQPADRHFLTENMTRYDFGEGQKNIYAIDGDTTILHYENGTVNLAVKEIGAGRSVYISGLPYCAENADLLLRSIHFAAHKEAMLKQWYSDDVNVEVHYYPKAGKSAVINNSSEERTATVFDGAGVPCRLTLAGGEIVWRESYDI